MLERVGMKDCYVVHAPMEERLKLSKDSSQKAEDATLYRSIIGNLRYLVHTRPDITFVVGYLSRFMEARQAITSLPSSTCSGTSRVRSHMDACIIVVTVRGWSDTVTPTMLVTWTLGRAPRAYYSFLGIVQSAGNR